MNRPNILWILTDEQRADSLGCNGAPWARTPCLDRLAAQGVNFAAACTPSPVCVSARAAMLTGQSNPRLGVLNNHHHLAPERARFLPRCFVEQGYAVASFGKHHYNCREVRAFPLEGGTVLDDRAGYTEYRVPVDEEEAGVVYYPTEFRHWILAGRFPGGVADTAEAKNAALALGWLAKRDPGQPFFLRLSLNAPHTPVLAPAPYDTAIDPESIDLPIDGPDDLDLPAPVRENLVGKSGTGCLARAQILRLRQVYYGRVAFLDEVLRQFLGEAAAMGALDHTYIVFAADHGCHLADHGFVQKQSFYEASVRVPFLFAGPGIAPGTVRTPVSIGSILPTCLDLAGIGIPDPTDFPSLAPALRNGAEPTPEPVFSDLDFGIWGYRDGDRYAMVREGDWKLALFRDPQDKTRFPEDDGIMLHHLADDPGERHNLASRPEHRATLRRLLERIDARDQALARR
jgi:arylsulfatase A-like enzyme